tara:strand:+ start:1067 stop:1984 length:918 start_codon:yes stop_codon:yes gene_type:complete
LASILVTGGCGFIGINLVEKLVHEGHSVRVLDSNAYSSDRPLPSSVEFIEGSARDPDILGDAFKNIERCVHLAGNSVLRDPRGEKAGAVQVFMESVKPLFAAAAEAGADIVYASSAAVYGEPNDIPIREDAPLLPVSAHGVEKLALETCAAQFAETTGLASLGLRMFNVFGPGQNPASPYCGVVRKFVDKLLHDEPVTLYGDGSQTRDFVFVDDVTDSISRLVSTPLKGADVVNICSGEEVTVRTVISVLEQAFNRRFEVRYEEADSTMVSVSVGDPTKGRRKYGIKKFMSFSEGANRMVDRVVV